MSDLLHQHSIQQPPAAEGVQATAREQVPDASGVGRAQRSEPERSDGERSGARPTPLAAPLVAPIGQPVPDHQASPATRDPRRGDAEAHRQLNDVGAVEPAPIPDEDQDRDEAETVSESSAGGPGVDALGRRLRLTGRSRGRRLVKKETAATPTISAEQRLLGGAKGVSVHCFLPAAL